MCSVLLLAEGPTGEAIIGWDCVLASECGTCSAKLYCDSPWMLVCCPPEHPTVLAVAWYTENYHALQNWSNIRYKKWYQKRTWIWHNPRDEDNWSIRPLHDWCRQHWLCSEFPVGNYRVLRWRSYRGLNHGISWWWRQGHCGKREIRVVELTSQTKLAATRPDIKWAIFLTLNDLKPLTLGLAVRWNFIIQNKDPNKNKLP